MLENHSLFNRRNNEPSLEEINYVFKAIEELGFDPFQVKLAKLEAISRSIPRLASAAEEGKKLILSQMEFEQVDGLE